MFHRFIRAETPTCGESYRKLRICRCHKHLKEMQEELSRELAGRWGVRNLAAQLSEGQLKERKLAEPIFPPVPKSPERYRRPNVGSYF